MASRGGGSDVVGPRGRRLLAAIALAYIALVLGLAATGVYAAFPKNLAFPAFLLFAVLLGRATPLIRDWALFVAAILLFDAGRGFVYALITSLDLPWYARYVIDWEEWLLAGHTFPGWLQARYHVPGTISPLETFYVLVHGSHFVVFLLFGLTVWALRNDDFWRFAGGLCVVMYLGLVIYLAVPTVPPWKAAELGLIDPIEKIVLGVYNTSIPRLQAGFDVNPIAAMPSLHAAFPSFLTLVAFTHFGARAIPLALYTLAVYMASGHLGEHYVVDLIAGAALSTLAWWIFYRSPWSRRAAARRAPPSDRWSPALTRRVVAAVMIFFVAEIVGNVSVAIRGGLRVDEHFIRAELMGRSTLAHYLLALGERKRGDHAAAAASLSAATDELRDPELMAVARRLLTNYAWDPAQAPVVFSSLRSRASDPWRRLVVAFAMHTVGRTEEAAATLAHDARQPDAAPESVYWHAWFGLDAGLVDEATARAAHERLVGSTQEGAANLAARLGERLAATP